MSDQARAGTIDAVADRIEQALGGGDAQEQNNQQARGREPQEREPRDEGLMDERAEDERDEEQDADEGDEPRGEQDTGDDDGAEGDADGQPSDDDDAADEEADEDPENLEQEPIESLDQLAKALEVSPEELAQKLKTTLTVDGEEVQVTLAEAFKGYQREADYSRKTMRLAEKEKLVQEREQTQTRQMELARQISKQQHDAMMQVLLEDLNSPQMRALQEKDPARYILARDRIRERAQRIQDAAQKAVHQFQSTEQESQESLRKELEAYKAEQLDHLKKAVPDWSSQKRDAVRAFMIDSLGYTDEEVGQIMDYRIIANAAKLMDAQQGKKPAGKQGAKDKGNTKAQEAPQGIMRPSRSDQPRRPGLSRKQKQLREARNRLRKSGKVADAAAVIEQTL